MGFGFLSKKKTTTMPSKTTKAVTISKSGMASLGSGVVASEKFGIAKTVTTELQATVKAQFKEDLLSSMDKIDKTDAIPPLILSKVTKTAVEMAKKGRKRFTGLKAPTDGVPETIESAVAEPEPTPPSVSLPGIIVASAARDSRATETGRPTKVSEETEEQRGPAAVRLEDAEKPFVLMTIDEDILPNGLPKRLVLIIKGLTSSRFRVKKYRIWRKSVFSDMGYKLLKELDSEQTRGVSPRYIGLVTSRGFNAGNFFSFVDADLVVGNVYAYKVEVEYDGNLAPAEEEDRIGHEIIESIIREDVRTSSERDTGAITTSRRGDIEGLGGSPEVRYRPRVF